MKRHASPRARLSAVVAVGLLLGCGPVPESSNGQWPPYVAAGEDAYAALADRYYRERARWQPTWAAAWGLAPVAGVRPDIDPQTVAARLRIDRAFLSRALAIDPRTLTPAGQAGRELWIHDLRQSIHGARFPEELLPLSAADGGFAVWAVLAPARGEVALNSLAQQEAWLAQLATVPDWVEQALTNMETADARGLRLAPEAWQWLARRIGVALTLPLTPPSGAWGVGLTRAEQQALTARYRVLTDEQVRPALRRLQQRSLVAAQRARGFSRAVWSDLPLGEAWYVHRLDDATDLPLTPQEWHAAGLAGVARLEGLLAAAPWPAAPPATVGAAPAQSAVPELPVLLLERLPMAAVPRWQRRTQRPAHRDGYGLYRLLTAVPLAVEPDAAAAALHRRAALEQARGAVAMVAVDTGLHALGWSREQALHYLAAHTAWSALQAADHVDAALASAATGLAAGAGCLRLLQLRTAVEQLQGAAFAAEAFDRQLVADGPLPLDALESRMMTWARRPATGSLPAQSAPSSARK